MESKYRTCEERLEPFLWLLPRKTISDETWGALICYNSSALNEILMQDWGEWFQQVKTNIILLLFYIFIKQISYKSLHHLFFFFCCLLCEFFFKYILFSFMPELISKIQSQYLNQPFNSLNTAHMSAYRLLLFPNLQVQGVYYTLTDQTDLNVTLSIFLSEWHELYSSSLQSQELLNRLSTELGGAHWLSCMPYSTTHDLSSTFLHRCGQRVCTSLAGWHSSDLRLSRIWLLCIF